MTLRAVHGFIDAGLMPDVAETLNRPRAAVAPDALDEAVASGRVTAERGL
jgi:hypothetical protein